MIPFTFQYCNQFIAEYFQKKNCCVVGKKIKPWIPPKNVRFREGVEEAVAHLPIEILLELSLITK